MSTQKLYTEREMVMAQREAFEAGADAYACFVPWKGSAAEAAVRYPLPKVTRPRVVRDAEAVDADD
jgi:hypothetical protein